MDDDNIPFGEPDSPAREAWRKLFGEPSPPVLDESATMQREIDEVLERIYDAFEHENLGSVVEILRECPDLTRPPHADALLTSAVERDQQSVVDALLKAGVPAHAIDGSGGTPLMAAAWLGRLGIARRLLQAGADPDILVEDHCDGGDPEVVGGSALFFDLAKGHQDLVELLEPVTRTDIRALAYLELPRYLQWRAENPPPHVPTVRLFMAIQEKRPDRLREAIATGGKVNDRLPQMACNRLYGGTPLCFAAATGRMDLVGPLLEAGAHPGLVGLDGRTPADIAALNGHSELAEMLRAASQRPTPHHPR